MFFLVRLLRTRDMSSLFPVRCSNATLVRCLQMQGGCFALSTREYCN